MEVGNRTIDFLIIGAMKSGTTSVADMLNQHPQLQMASTKEPMYFLNNSFSLVKDLKQYHGLWNWEEQDVLRFEASTAYTGFPEYPGVPQRIKDYNPDMKLIYIVRDPVDRIESHYAYRVSRAVNKYKDPEQEISEDSRFLERSQYTMQIEQYDEVFSKDAILILLFEDFLKDRDAFLDKIFSFLEIKSENLEEVWSNKSKDTARVNPMGKKLGKTGLAKLVSPRLKQIIKQPFVVKLKEKPTVSDEYKAKLYYQVRDEAQRLGRRMGREITQWKSYD